MEAVVLLAFTLTLSFLSSAITVCPVGYTEVGGFCYKFTPSVTGTFDEARTSCQQQSGHIVVEISAEEHTAFVTFRQSLGQSGDPFWTGLWVRKAGSWSFLSDSGFLTTNSSTLYMNWQGGSMPRGDIGDCAVTVEDNGDQVWQKMPCSFPLSYICETTPISTPAPATTTKAGAITTTTSPATSSSPLSPSDFVCRVWRKIYPNSKFASSTYVVPSVVMTPKRSLSRCAVLCSTSTQCVAFNHRPMDNECQHILAKVNGSDVTPTSGWNVWVETLY